LSIENPDPLIAVRGTSLCCSAHRGRGEPSLKATNLKTGGPHYLPSVCHPERVLWIWETGELSFLEVPSEPFSNFTILACGYLFLELVEGKVDDVVVVELLRR